MTRFIPTSPEKVASVTRPFFAPTDEGAAERWVQRDATDHAVNFHLEHVDPVINQIGSTAHKAEVTQKLLNVIENDEDDIFLNQRIVDIQHGYGPNWHYQGVSTSFSFKETAAWTVNRLVRDNNALQTDHERLQDNMDICYREKHETEYELESANYRLNEQERQMAKMRKQIEAMRQALVANQIHPTTFQPLQPSARRSYKDAKEDFDKRQETVEFGKDSDSDEF